MMGLKGTNVRLFSNEAHGSSARAIVLITILSIRTNFAIIGVGVFNLLSAIVRWVA